MTGKGIGSRKRPRSIDNSVWNIYRRYCNAVERGEDGRAERARRSLWICGYSLAENGHGQIVPVKTERVIGDDKSKEE